MEPLLWFHLNVHHDFTLRYAQMPIVGTSSGPRKKWVQLHLGTRMFFSVGLSNSPTSKNSIYLHELAWVSSLIHHDILKVWTDNFALTTHMNMIEMFLPPTNHCTSYSCRADRLIIFVQVRSCWAISSSVSGLLSRGPEQPSIDALYQGYLSNLSTECYHVWEPITAITFKSCLFSKS